MHLTDDVAKLKLFMDVLDGTKAAVTSHNITHLYNCVPFSSAFKLMFSSPVDNPQVCALSAPWVRDGHPSPHPPQAVEKV